MVDVFGDSDVGGFQKLPPFTVCTKVEKNSGKFIDYTKEIQESYRLGFTPYRSHKKPNGEWITPVRVYDGRIYASDNEGAYPITNDVVDRLIYWVRKDSTDDNTISALEGPEGKQGKQGVQGEKGLQGPRGERGPIGEKGRRGEIGITGPQGKRGADGPVGPTGERGPKGPKGDKGERGSPGIVGDNLATKTFVIDMVEQATSLECAFIASPTKDVTVLDNGLELNSWEVSKKDGSVVQLIEHGFAISQQSRFSVYLHCQEVKVMQKNVEFQIYSLSESKPVVIKKVDLLKDEMVSILLHHRIDENEKLSVRVFGKDLDFKISTLSRVEVTETHRWEAPELIVGNIQYPWKSNQEIKLVNDMGKYSLIYITAKKKDAYICKTILPLGMKLPSSMHKLNDPWELNIDDKITLRFVGYQYKIILNIKETNGYEIISMYGVRC